MLIELVKELQTGKPLSDESIAAAVAALVEESRPAEEKADFLIALADKGESPAEIAGFARRLRGLSIRPELDAETRSREILDVCGTGGDKLNTFNISSTVAIIAASAGVMVAKHGNRAITSSSGSSEVLQELGIPTRLTPAQAAESLRRHNFAFFFAPDFHPAFKHIAPARKLCAERGRRTIFNFLGPLLNPAAPTAQLMGLPRPELCEPIAQVLQALGARRAMVVSGKTPEGYLDEISISGETTIAEFYHDRGFNRSTLNVEDFFPPSPLSELRGGTPKENAQIIHGILSGTDRGPRRAAVALNSAAALFVAGMVKSMSEGLERTEQLLDSGKSLAKLEELVKTS